VTLLRTAGVRRIRLHDDRHTTATLLLAEDAHHRVVMELLGHSAMRTAMCESPPSEENCGQNRPGPSP
jgi:integrase